MQGWLRRGANFGEDALNGSLCAPKHRTQVLLSVDSLQSELVIGRC